MQKKRLIRKPQQRQRVPAPPVLQLDQVFQQRPKSGCMMDLLGKPHQVAVLPQKPCKGFLEVRLRDQRVPRSQTELGAGYSRVDALYVQLVLASRESAASGATSASRSAVSTSASVSNRSLSFEGGSVAR